MNSAVLTISEPKKANMPKPNITADNRTGCLFTIAQIFCKVLRKEYFKCSNLSNRTCYRCGTIIPSFRSWWLTGGSTLIGTSNGTKTGTGSKGIGSRFGVFLWVYSWERNPSYWRYSGSSSSLSLSFLSFLSSLSSSGCRLTCFATFSKI